MVNLVFTKSSQDASRKRWIGWIKGNGPWATSFALELRLIGRWKCSVQKNEKSTRSSRWKEHKNIAFDYKVSPKRRLEWGVEWRVQSDWWFVIFAKLRWKEEGQSFCFKVSRPMQRLFAMAIDYLMYRLNNKFRRFDSRVASIIDKSGRKLRSRRWETDFDKTDLISILAFLKKFCYACDSTATHKGAATCFIFHNVRKPPSSYFEAWSSQLKIRSNGLHDDKLSNYIEVVNYLLPTFVT